MADDHGAYSPSYFVFDIKEGQLIAINKFVQEVSQGCKSYLQHSSHHGELNRKVGSYDIWNYPIPYNTGSPPTTGCVEWKTDYNSIINEVKAELDSFEEANAKKLVNADNTWEVLVKCFHKTCRIAEQRFSYYNSTSSSKTTTQYSIGLMDLYQTYLQYKDSVDYIRNKTDVLLKDKEKIIALNVQAAIHYLMSYNASKETVYNKGVRNYKNVYSEYVWGTSWYECDEGPFYDAWMAGYFNGYHVYYKMKYPPSGVADYQDKPSIWHHNYSDDHGHVYTTKYNSVNELKRNPSPVETTYSIHISG